MEIIDLKNVTKFYGNFKAVDSVSFSVEPGRIFGILGPNGAGKTSTIRMINYITVPDQGSITIEGKPVGRESQEHIGYLPEERGLYKKMKVGEQLLYLVQLKGLSKADAKRSIKYWLGRFEASDWINKHVHELSKGMQQKIQFIVTIAHDPDIYIFDEPFSGLDPINSELLKKVIIELRDKGKTIIFATHRMEQVEQMCDDIALFNRGKAILQGKLSDVKRSFGRNTVILEFDGDASFIDELENVRVNNRSTNFAEIRLLNGTSEQTILEKAVNNVKIRKFEFVQPSLNEIFISTVGEDNIKNNQLG
ncbi:MAG TPA: ATP-binding cassette domain-containing protein [Balneolales bacterium]|nr:ATP-binding cassette domain-containing protein [Balneolales bacterium]